MKPVPAVIHRVDDKAEGHGHSGRPALRRPWRKYLPAAWIGDRQGFNHVVDRHIGLLLPGAPYWHRAPRRYKTDFGPGTIGAAWPPLTL